MKTTLPEPLRATQANAIFPGIPIQHRSTGFQPARSADMLGRVLLVALTLFGAACTGGREIPKNCSRTELPSPPPRNAFDAQIRLSDTAEPRPWGLAKNSLPLLISPEHPPRDGTVEQDAARRRSADQQLERFHAQQARSHAQARLTAAWKRALLAASWQQHLQP